MVSKKTPEVKTESKPQPQTGKKKKPRTYFGIAGEPEGLTGERTTKRGPLYVVGSVLPSGKGSKPVKPFKGKVEEGDACYASRSTDGSARIGWYGIPFTGILRFMGDMDATVAEATEWMERAGYPNLSVTTVKAQVGSGRAGRKGNEPGHPPGGYHGNGLPKFTTEQRKYWMSLRPAAK